MQPSNYNKRLLVTVNFKLLYNSICSIRLTGIKLCTYKVDRGRHSRKVLLEYIRRFRTPKSLSSGSKPQSSIVFFLNSLDLILKNSIKPFFFKKKVRFILPDKGSPGGIPWDRSR
jgi:hypothetical protein